MSLLDDLRARDDLTTAAAAALQAALGDNAPTIATASTEISAFVGDEQLQVRTLEFHTATEDGLVALLMTPALADGLERSAADETLPTGVAPVLEAVVGAIGAVAGEEIESETAIASDRATVVERGGDGSERAIAYIISGTDEAAVGCLVVAVGAATATDQTITGAVVNPSGAAAADAGTPKVLADVEMGVTAELGRCRMSVRELLALTPGAVIDLDRAAGAPVDVLVNGTLIARGEVVVVDEEFGIRISEILTNGVSAA